MGSLIMYNLPFFFHPCFSEDDAGNAVICILAARKKALLLIVVNNFLTEQYKFHYDENMQSM